MNFNVIYWIFKVQAILLFLFWGLNTIIPLAVTPLVSIFWILFGVGIWFVAGGIRDGKDWAPITALFVTTLPYLILPMIMNFIQKNITMIFEGSRDVGIFDISFIFIFLFLGNLVLSVIFILKNEEYSKIKVKKKKNEKWNSTPMTIAVILLVISVVSAATWFFWKAAGLQIVPFTITFLGSIVSFILSLVTFVKQRKEGRVESKLYRVSKSVMIISIIIMVITVPIEIMVIRFTISPPEHSYGLSIPPNYDFVPDDSPRSEWREHRSDYGFSVEYPPSWFIDQNIFEGTSGKQVVLRDPFIKSVRSKGSIERGERSSSAALISIFQSRSDGGFWVGNGEETSLAGREAYLHSTGISSDIYIPFEEGVYILKVYKYEEEQVQEILDSINIF